MPSKDKEELSTVLEANLMLIQFNLNFTLKMSYTEICDKFETVAAHLRKGAQIGSSLSNFFKSYKKSLDSFSQQILKHTENLSSELPKDIEVSTLIPALNMLVTHFKRINQQQLSLSRCIQLEIIDPLDSFINQINNSNSASISKGAPTYRQLHKSRQKMEKLKNKHFMCSQKAETADLMLAQDVPVKELFKLQKQAGYYRLVANRASETYEKSVHDANLNWNNYDTMIPGIMVSLQQNEESRIHFFKYSLEKYIKHHTTFQSNTININSELLTVLENINSEIDIKSFVDSNRSTKLKNREEFISYDRWKKMSMESKLEEIKLNDSFEELEDDAVSVIIADVDPDVELLNTVLDYLFSNSSISTSEETEDLNYFPDEKPIDSNHYAGISELLHTPEGRELFIDALEAKKTTAPLEVSKITQLAALIKTLLTMMLIEDDREPGILIKILNLSHEIWAESNSGASQTLCSFISSHNI